MKKIYAEVGIGNKSFFSTEIEKENKEYRIKKFLIPNHLEEIYIRLWLFKLVLIISFFKGVKLKKKDQPKFKLVLGVGGRE